MMDVEDIVSPRSLRSRTASKRKYGNDDDYKKKLCHRNKKKPALLSSSESSLDSENGKFTNSRVNEKVVNSARGATKLFPIFQSLASKSKEIPETKSPSDDDEVPKSNRKLKVRLTIRKCKSTGKSDGSGDMFEVVENRQCDEAVSPITKGHVNSPERAAVEEVINKVHPIFETTRATRQGKKCPDSENTVLSEESAGRRSLRSKVKRDMFLDVEIISKDVEEGVTKKRSKHVSKIKKRFMKKEIRATNKNVVPTKLHPIFLSPMERTKLALETKKVKRPKGKEGSLELSANDCIMKNIIDDELNTSVEEKHVQNHNPLENLSILKGSTVLNSGHSIQYGAKDFKNEVCFPLMSHVKQISAPLYQVRAAIGMAVSEDLEDEDYALSWNGVLGLLEEECMERLSDIKNTNCKSHPSANLVVNDNNVTNLRVNNQYPSFQTDSSLHDLNSDKKLSATDEDMSWDAMVRFGVDKLPASSPVGAVKSWLECWKLKCSKSSSNDCNLDDDDYGSEGSGDDDLEKAIIVYGYPGTGKTSTVHMLAHSLDFSVLEVNASSCRTGRHITSQLQEAFHSYGVHNTIFQDSKKVLVEKDQTSSSDGDSSECEVLDTKCNIPVPKRECRTTLKQSTLFKQLETKNEKKISSNSKSKCKNIANFFTKLKTTNEMPDRNTKSNVNSASDSSAKSEETDSEKSSQQSAVSDKKVSTVILFDDVDVVFDEDDGFWCAVNTFLKTTKRPVIFTISRNLEIVLNNLNDNYEVINFNNMGLEIDYGKDLEQVCGEMCIPNASKVLKTSFANDMRKCLLHLLFWNKKKISHPKSYDYSKINSCRFDATPEMSSVNDRFSQLFLDTIRPIVHSDNFLDKLHLIAYHHCIDSDVLYLNLFHILPSIDCKEWQQLWHRVNDDYFKATTAFIDPSMGKRKITKDVDVLSSVPEVKSDIAHQRSKESLHRLKCLSSAFSDFSFTNVLKAQFGFNNFLWLSTNERLKLWSTGLPACIDDVYPVLETTFLEVISAISLLSTRKCCQNLPLVQTSNSRSILTSDENAPAGHVQHFDNVLPSSNNSKESHIQQISSILPLVQQLNTRSIVLDYFSFLQIICKFEAQKKKTFQRSRRFLHYFDSISLNLDPDIFDYSLLTR